MSRTALDWAFSRNLRATDGRLTLLVLAELCDETNSCYPDDHLLQMMTGQALPALRRQLTLLEGAGYIGRAPMTVHCYPVRYRYVLNPRPDPKSAARPGQGGPSTPVIDDSAMAGDRESADVLLGVLARRMRLLLLEKSKREVGPPRTVEGLLWPHTRPGTQPRR